MCYYLYFLLYSIILNGGGSKKAFRTFFNTIFSLRVTTSIYPVPSICAQDQISDWFDSLAECLHWNVRKRQKHLDELTDLTHSSSNDTLDSLDHTDLIEKDNWNVVLVCYGNNCCGLVTIFYIHNYCLSENEKVII